MTPNVALIEQTMQHLLDHPEDHNQSAVFNECGTPACFVGWAMYFSGITAENVDDYLETTTCTGWAAEHLGIDVVDAGKIFRGTNTLPMLHLMVKDLLNGDGLQTHDHYFKEAHPNGLTP